MSLPGRSKRILTGEAELIALLRSMLAGRGGRILTPIGDDAAVVRARERRDLVLTTDTFVEGVHYRKEWAKPREIGVRAMAAALSDIAAMAAEPVAALVSLGLPDAPCEREITELYDGLAGTAARNGCPIVGGETVRTRKDTVITVSILGEVERGQALSRSGARPGDTIWVSGTLGRREAALRCLEAGCGARKFREKMRRVFFQPLPRIREAIYLREHLPVTAMIDSSDGLSTDLSHILAESWVGARISARELPIAQEALEVAGMLEESPLEYALHGGEDYELLFTVRGGIDEPLRRRFAERFDTGITRIGNIADSGFFMEDIRGDMIPLAARGFDHLRRRAGR